MKQTFGSFLWFITMAALGAWFAVMALDDKPPFKYMTETEGNYISPNPVKQEGAVVTHWVLTDVKRNCPRQIERIYSDRDTGEVMTTQDATPMSRVLRADQNKISRSFNLPPGLPPRVYYQARACFQCNLLHLVFPLCVTSPKLSINIAPS